MFGSSEGIFFHCWVIFDYCCSILGPPGSILGGILLLVVESMLGPFVVFLIFGSCERLGDGAAGTRFKQRWLFGQEEATTASNGDTNMHKHARTHKDRQARRNTF